VVITLAVDRGLEDTGQIRVYLTPTVVYFASVLGVAALLAFPNHTRATAAFCTCPIGVVGLIYSGVFLAGRGRKKIYYEQSDMIPYAGFPFVAYGLLVLGGTLLLHDAQRGLTIVAIGML
jgi:hypothetical protein